MKQQIGSIKQYLYFVRAVRRTRQGFLLLELMVYVGLAMTLLYLLYGSLWRFHDIHQRIVRSNLATYHTATVVNLLARDLLVCYPPVVSSSQEIILYKDASRTQKITWRCEKNSLYRIEDGAKNVLMRHVRSLQYQWFAAERRWHIHLVTDNRELSWCGIFLHGTYE